MGERVFFYWLTRGHRSRGINGEKQSPPRSPRSYTPIGWPMTQNLLESAASGHAQSLADALPGYGVNTANEKTIQVTAAPVLSRNGFDTLHFGQESSSTSTSKICACIVCLKIGIRVSNSNDPYNCRQYHCRSASCSWVDSSSLREPYYWEGSDKRRALHEQSHCRQHPKDDRSPVRCPVQNCRFSSKRWCDLQRHTTAKHCNNPTKFACSVIGCKYYGEGNGFTRKDKLKDHYKTVHQSQGQRVHGQRVHEQRVHGQALRAIEPAPAPVPASYDAEASGSSSIGAQGTGGTVVFWDCCGTSRT